MSKTGALGFFVRHKVAANLLMLVMLMGGVIGLSRMNIQFFPTFALDFVTVQVVWNGAAAEDVEKAVEEEHAAAVRAGQNVRDEILPLIAEKLDRVTFSHAEKARRRPSSV